MDWQPSNLALKLTFTADSKHIVASMADMYTRLYTLSYDRPASATGEAAASSAAARAQAATAGTHGRAHSLPTLVASHQFDEDGTGADEDKRAPAEQILSGLGGFDQKFVVSGTPSGGVHVWNRASGNLLCTLTGHTDHVSAVAWNPVDAHMMVSASDDHTMRVWTSPAMQGLPST